jgi:anti-sigma factor RsiW
MSCDRMEGRLLAYMDGRATEADRRSVESHLENCGACRARVRGFQGVWGILEELPEHEPSSAFDVRLQARLAAEPVKTSFWNWLVPAPRMALALTLLAICSVWLSTRPTAPASQSSTAAVVSSESDFSMIKDLPVLENYDVLSSFDALSQLPAQQQAPDNN